MIDRQLKQFVLKYLLSCENAGRGAVAGVELRQAIRSGFPGVAFTEGDLKQAIAACEAGGWIDGTNDDLLGILWLLTPSGKIRAQQL